MHEIAGQGHALAGYRRRMPRQNPADLIFITAADSELACLAQARALMPAAPSALPPLTLAGIITDGLPDEASVNRYLMRMQSAARLVIARLIGGRAYWPHGVDGLVRMAAQTSCPLILLPGDGNEDPDLLRASTVDPAFRQRIWLYCQHGGTDNFRHMLASIQVFLAGRSPLQDRRLPPPKEMPRAGVYNQEKPDDAQSQNKPLATIVFYRALIGSGLTDPVDTLRDALRRQGFRTQALYIMSLKDETCGAFVAQQLAADPPAVIVNLTTFAVSSPGAWRQASPFDGVSAPVLQAIISGGSKRAWAAHAFGLSARDIAMNVALPEVDGRLMTRAVSFKQAQKTDSLVQYPLMTYQPDRGRARFVAQLARAWVRLRQTPVEKRRVAFVLGNYPNRDGRIGNGVGLDVPAAMMTCVKALAGEGYRIEGFPKTSEDLMAAMLAGPTNDLTRARDGGVRFSLAAYGKAFRRLPLALQRAVTARWGEPIKDPFVRDGDFVLAVKVYGHIAVGIQPARGYNIDPVAAVHDPDLVPPHGYFAFYFWLRKSWGMHGLVHLGKHGTAEWLPGKALALSARCYPEAVIGPTPLVYPFIVNDPGEGSQAKRRNAAVIIDHLTPPLTRAETYGPLRELEMLVDEYYEASAMDPHRAAHLREDIIALSRRTGLDKDSGLAGSRDDLVSQLDNYLCELKEAQIRDGLHIFGESPKGDSLHDLLVSLTRLPRGDGQGGDESILRAIARDLQLDGFDPLAADFAEPWAGPRPPALAQVSDDPWRTAGDTLERLERLARRYVEGCSAPSPGSASADVLARIDEAVRPAVIGSGQRELTGLLRGVRGDFVEPGPSGAPSRGRLDVLPTGRNFYSLDTRTVPTPTAWHIGWHSAQKLVQTHRERTGQWLRAIALTAWGTANMRTGGDDLAQALALMGVKPTWDTASRRVTGITVLPLSVLDRPRVDVTLRISGFFRDAFPQQIGLVAQAVTAVAERVDEGADNPLAQRTAQDEAKALAEGLPAVEARLQARYRIFGAKPGAYGAGLQTLLDEDLWEDAGDLARAFIAWGGYAYGQEGFLGTAPEALERRLARIDAVVHNQDNREHDLLDSDDYYQFEGGLAVTASHLSGRRPTVYHNDHARPHKPIIRTLEEEVARVVRSRVVNPKWIASIMRHGYKGAFEMAATVDYLFAFAATTGAVADHHFDAVFDAYLADEEVRAFLEHANPAAARDIARRLLQAQERMLWRPLSNHAYDLLSQWSQTLGKQSIKKSVRVGSAK
ncbi:MAG: cobaltochelatase subunit CobN [Pseudomonadota bacterium]